jgi:DivIVA domain-containing protein
MTSELDLPLLPSAEQIRRREFATIRRGYDPDQVRDYLLQVAAQVEILEQELRDARLKTSAGRPSTDVSPGERLAAETAAAPSQQRADDVYEQLAKRFSGLIATADKEASRIVDDAKAESSRIVDRARSEADRIRVDAQARAEEARQQGNEALDKAREEAQRILAGLSHRRESLVSQMDEMRGKLLSVARDLESALSESGPHGPRPDPQTTTYRPTPASTSASSPVSPSTPSPGSSSTSQPTPSTRPSEQRTPSFSSAPSGAQTSDDPVDPRYEDLWVSPPASSREDPNGTPRSSSQSTPTQGTPQGPPRSTVDIPDLAAIDVDFDDERRND